MDETPIDIYLLLVCFRNYYRGFIFLSDFFYSILFKGNISKYIGDEEADLATSVTHKWLIYITAKTPVPVEQIVSRARFFLHESYKPNDVAEVR